MLREQIDNQKKDCFNVRMSTSFEETAIILKVIPFEERHLIVTLLTENYGKISAVANNAINSRRFGSSLQVFSASLFKLNHKENASLYRIDESILKKGFEGLRTQYEVLCVASFFTEIMMIVAPENENVLDLFKLHSNALFGLEEKIISDKEISLESLLKFANGYIAKILQWNGTQPKIMSCLSCQKSLLDFEPDTLFRMSIVVAGWICPNCKHYKISLPDENPIPLHQTYLSLTQRSIGDFALGLTHPIRKSYESFEGNENEQKNLLELLTAMLQYHVPGFDKAPLKSLKMLESVFTL